MKHKQKQPWGCGLYAVANACNLDDFVTEERLEISKNGNVIGQLSKWMQDDGLPFYIDTLYYNHTGKNLPQSALSYHPIGESVEFLPVLINVQLSEEGKRHMVGGKIDKEQNLYLYDSLDEEMQVTTLSKVNKKYYRVFGLFIFMSVENGDYVFI